MRSALDLFRLGGKVALVTGGTGIVGRPISQALAEAGATVIVASRNKDKCAAFANKLKEAGHRAEGERLDLSSEDEIRSVCDQILSRHQRLDIVFNNAVARAGGDLRHMTAPEWEEAMRVNSTGLFLACQIFSKPMQEQRAGSIINISSIYGMVGPDFSIYEGTSIINPVNYAFAKGGIISLTRYLASFLAPDGIRVNCLSLGGVRTPDTPEVFERNYRRRMLLGRMANEDDIKGPALFLASDASSYVTGQNIPVDGGWTAI
jgi:NAD(P)-dependent dehydrogenase (short-subunit alcohol dehydrogenase family)